MDLVIIGGGRHALVVRDCLGDRARQVIGILDDRLAPGTMLEDLPVLGTTALLPALRQQYPSLCGIIAVGDNHARRSIAERIQALLPDFVWAEAVHPSAIVSPYATIAPGAVVVAGAIVNSHASIGRQALINSGSIVDHDTCVGAFASTGPGVVTGGNVSIGEGTHIGIGAVVVHGVAIGNHCVVGGNSYVCRNVPDHVVCYGTPARVIRYREPSDPYL